MKLNKGLVCIAIFAVYLIAFTATAVCNNIWLIKKYDASFREKDGGYIYISLQQESNPLEMSDTLSPISLLREMYDRLSSMNVCTYYEIYKQSLDCLNDFGCYFEYGTGDLTDLKGSAMCVQISENVQYDFGFSELSGRLFTQEDFSHENDDLIPVLLGCEYYGMHQPGDIFTGEYLFNEYSFEVVGFLDEGAGITLSTGSISLGKYIILPSIDFEDPPRDDSEYVSQLIHYANKTSGKIRTSLEECDRVLAEVQEIIESSDTGVYSVSTSSLTKNLFSAGVDIDFIFVVCVFLSIVATTGAAFLTVRQVKRYHIKTENRGKILHVALIKNMYLVILVLVAALVALAISYVGMKALGFVLLGNWCIYLCVISILAILLSVVLLGRQRTASKSHA